MAKLLTNYERWQKEKYGNILPATTADEDLESGIEQLEKLAEDIEAYNEKELNEEEVCHD